MSIEAMKQALEALDDLMGWQTLAPAQTQRDAHQAITSLRQAIEQAERQQALDKGEEHMSIEPITDDNGQAVQPQFRVIEQRGNWFLLYDQHVVGNLVRHEFRIQKLKHDIVLYSGITLEEAKKRFAEKFEADYE